MYNIISAVLHLLYSSCSFGEYSVVINDKLYKV